MAVEGKEPSVAPVLLGRISGLSPEDLNSMLARDAVALIEEVERVEDQMEELRPGLEDALYSVVPSLDRNTRRAALTVRRAIHNGRPPQRPKQFFEQLLANLDDTLRSVLNQWLDFAYRLKALEKNAEESFSMELENAEHRLLPLLRQPDVLNGLAFASPDFTQTLLRSAHDARPAPADSQLGRACISFAARTAVKLSPFSTLTTLGQTTFDIPGGSCPESGPKADRIEKNRGASSVYLLSKALATWALRACAFDEELKHTFIYRTTDAMRSVDGRLLGLQPEYKVFDGRFFRSDSVMDMRAYAKQFNILAGRHEGTYGDWLEKLGGAGPDVAFERLLAGNMIRPIAPWKIGDPAPLRGLIDHLNEVGSERGAAAAQILHEVEYISGAGRAMSTEQRIDSFRDIAKEARRFFRFLDHPIPPWLQGDGRNLIYEDARSPVALPALPESVKDDLKTLARWMRPFTIRTAVYRLLVDFFIKKHGSGGEAQDVLGFLLEFSSQPGLDMQLYPLLAAPHDPEAWKKAVGPSSTPPTYMVFFQLIARNEEALRAGDYKLVINQVNNGLGGLVTRFDHVLSGGAGSPAPISSPIMEWIDALFPGSSPVHIPASADWNGLQNKGLEHFPVLEWPGEWPTKDGGEGVSLRELSLKHREDDDTLVLLGPDGRPAAPIYMGVVPHELTMGPLRHFFTLLNPWENRADMTWRPSIWRRRNPLRPDEIERFSRQDIGRIVTKRAAWRMHPREFPRRTTGESKFEYFRKANRWRKHLGMPMEVFFRPESAGRMFTSGKPVWLHFSNFHSILNAAHIIESGGDGFSAITFEEALPSLDEHWFRPENDIFATEFVGLVAWPHKAAAGEKV